MAAIETLAVIFSVLVLIKIIVLLVNPKSWMNLTDSIYNNSSLWTIIFLVLALISGYYLLQVFSIAEIAAVMFFTSVLMGLGWMPYSKTLMKVKNDVIKQGIGKSWLVTVIFVIIAVWVLFGVFV